MNARKTLVGILAAAIAFTAIPAQAVELHGYLRTGIGGNEDGGNQVCFLTAPVGYKFRLGNECETYAELEFGQTLYRDRSGVQFDYVGMLHYKTGGLRNAEPLNNNSGGNTAINELALRQNYIIAKNLPFMGGAAVWVGNRYYRRNDLHILDFFYWDASGQGAGIEDVDLAGFAKVAFAVLQNKGGWGLGYDRSDKTAIWRPDLRIYSIPFFFGGNLELGAELAINSGSPRGADVQKVSPMFTLQHVQPGLLGGFNKLAFQYATGTIAPMTGYPEPQNSDKAERWRIVEQMVVQPNSLFSGMLAFVYEDVSHQYGDVGPWNSFKTWSLGARPVYHVNDYFKLQAEVGYQSFKPKDPPTDEAKLFTASFAPTISPAPGPGGAFFVRPELRLFVTYANWNTAEAGFLQSWNAVYYSGPNGNGPSAVFGDKKHGVTFGAQVETWF